MTAGRVPILLPPAARASVTGVRSLGSSFRWRNGRIGLLRKGPGPGESDEAAGWAQRPQRGLAEAPPLENCAAAQHSRVPTLSALSQGSAGQIASCFPLVGASAHDSPGKSARTQVANVAGAACHVTDGYSDPSRCVSSTASGATTRASFGWETRTAFLGRTVVWTKTITDGYQPFRYQPEPYLLGDTFHYEHLR